MSEQGNDDPTAPGWLASEAPPPLTPPPRALTPSGARRVPPSPSAPRVSARAAAQLAAADAASAEGYDALDTAGERVMDQAEQTAAVAQALADGAVVVAELEVSDSVVFRLERLVKR